MFLYAEGQLSFPWDCSYTIKESKELDIFCFVSNDQSWSLSEFRLWMRDKFGNISDHFNAIEVNLHLNCQYSGVISLNKPIKVKGLRKLFVEGCTILEYMVYDLSDDMFELEDKLEIFETVNSVYKIRYRELISLYNRDIDEKINRMYPCEHNKNLKRFVERNVSYIMTGYNELTTSEIMKLKEDFPRSLVERNVCIYHHLVYYEVSSSTQDSATSLDTIRYLVANSKFPELRVFNFTNLGLIDVPTFFYKRDWWIALKHLNTLDFSHNQVSSLVFKHSSLVNKNQLRVDLRNNSFTKLTEDDIGKLKSFYPNTIDLRENPFVCTCENKALLSFIQNKFNSTWKRSYQYLRNVKCTSDKNKMKRMVDISISTICSTEKHVKSSTISLVYIAIVLFLVFVLVIVMFRFRHEIKVLAYNRLRIESRMTTSDSLLKEYDAFVSYSSLDETWVVQSLCKRLESSPAHFKLCIHHKHFVPGACISDNIIESVEKSRHTILVLSENFLKSEWCLLEFQKAFHQTLIERNRHLIVILLENVSEATLPVDMKHFLHTHTYINFTEPLFWDKLIYSLSERKGPYCCGIGISPQAIGGKNTRVQISSDGVSGNRD